MSSYSHENRCYPRLLRAVVAAWFLMSPTSHDIEVNGTHEEVFYREDSLWHWEKFEEYGSAKDCEAVRHLMTPSSLAAISFQLRAMLCIASDDPRLVK